MSLTSTRPVEGEIEADPLVGPRRRRRRATRRTVIGRSASLVLFVVFLVGWEVKGRGSGATLFSTPTAVVQRMGTMATEGELWPNLMATVWEMLGGLAIGMVIGVLMGYLMGRFRMVGTVLDPYVIAVNGLPRVALGPFFVVWFGIGLESKMVLAASLVFVGVLFNVRQGVESIDSDLVDAMRSMRASRWELTRHVYAPSLAPWTFAALKVAIGFSLTGAVIGELVGASEGLGWYISHQLSLIDITGAMAALVLLALLALVMYVLVLVLEARLLRWNRR
jgi:NitT/TauT family transport system permease protein